MQGQSVSFTLSFYRKKTIQPMRPYVPGEDLTGISVSPEDTPEEGGMIAVNPKNPLDQWYVAKKFFEDNYEPALPPNVTLGIMPPQTIGWAIKQMWNGEKVRRSGWNGKGMFIVLMPELNLPPYNTQGTERKVNDRTAKHIGEDTPLESQPYIAMFTAQGKWQPGWLASQADLLATDWELAD